MDYFKSLVEMVHQLEGTELTIVPATVGKVNPDATPDEEWGWVVAGLKEVYDLAREPRGVRLALEPLNRFETYFLNGRGGQAMALAEAVGPNCGVCLDVFHMNIEEKDMHAALRASKSRLVDVHVAENNRLAPGMGSVDWKAFVETLKDIGYDGALTMEAVAPIDRTPGLALDEPGRAEPGRHLPRAAEVHRGPRLEPALRGVLHDALRDGLRDAPARAHPLIEAA